jgi:hypothetical protein
MILSCSDINEIKECNNYSSAQGKCFLNGEVCRNVEAIGYCDELITSSLCSNATTDAYPNPLGDGINKYPCKWDNTDQLCERKISEIEKENPVQNDSNIIIIIVVVVVIALIIVVMIMIIILYKRKVNRNLKNSDIKDLEMESLKTSERSSSTGQKAQKRISFCYLFFILVVYFV